MFDAEIDAQKPVELYEVSFTGHYWYFTSADRDITYENKTYLSRAITRDDIVPSNDVNANKLQVTFPSDVAFGEVFRVQPPSEVVLIRLFVKNFMEPGFVVAWQGRIANVDWRFPFIEVTAESVFTSMSRPGLRRRYSATCPFALYGSSCRASRALFRESSDVLGSSGLSANVRAAIGKEENFYAGGYITWASASGGNVEKRMIRSSDPDGTLHLASFPIGLVPGQDVDIFPGCDHTIEMCASKFNNADNCGATPYIPRKNPFGGTSIY